MREREEAGTRGRARAEHEEEEKKLKPWPAFRFFLSFRLGFACALSFPPAASSRNRNYAASQKDRDKIHLRDSEKGRSLASAEGRESLREKGRHQQVLSTSPSSSASSPLSSSPKSCPFRTCYRATAASKARDSSGITRGRGGRLGGRRPGDMETPGESGYARRGKERKRGGEEQAALSSEQFFL